MAIPTAILDYIAQLEPVHQPLATKIHHFILEQAPAQTEAVISYKIPTYKYNGNLLHFAFAKKHIGLYPGPEAIQHFATELKSYKQTKGAIQIPYQKNFPYALLAKIIAYNANLLAQKTGPNWHNYRNSWPEAQQTLQDIVNQLPLQKTSKWGTEVYTYNKKNIVAWGGFKNFFSIWFYNGVFLSDPLQVLISANEGNTKALRQWRFTNTQQMPVQHIKAYIKEAIDLAEKGIALAPATKQPLQICPVLQQFLNQNPSLQTAFNALTPGKQKEYAAYIAEAKQDKTKQIRLNKIAPLITKGIGLNDKYKK